MDTAGPVAASAGRECCVFIVPQVLSQEIRKIDLAAAGPHRTKQALVLILTFGELEIYE